MIVAQSVENFKLRNFTTESAILKIVANNIDISDSRLVRQHDNCDVCAMHDPCALHFDLDRYRRHHFNNVAKAYDDSMYLKAAGTVTITNTIFGRSVIIIIILLFWLLFSLTL